MRRRLRQLVSAGIRDTAERWAWNTMRGLCGDRGPAGTRFITIIPPWISFWTKLSRPAGRDGVCENRFSCDKALLRNVPSRV